MFLLERFLLLRPWAAVFSLIYIPARLLSLKKPSPLRHEAALFLFWLTVVLILSQTLSTDGRLSGIRIEPGCALRPEYYNFRPFDLFRTWRGYIGTDGFAEFTVINVIGNVAVFVPLGYFFSRAYRKGIPAATLCGACLSVFIEICQIPMARHTDVDDVILNTLGAFIGGVAAAIVGRAVLSSKKRKEEGGSTDD